MGSFLETLQDFKKKEFSLQEKLLSNFLASLQAT